MKILSTVFLLAAFLVVVSGYVRPTPPRRCDYKCPSYDATVCAGNGICSNRFPSRCLLNKYNCLFPQKQFTVLDDKKCDDVASPQCTIGDL